MLNRQPNLADFGARLKRLRRNKDITQGDLAAFLGVVPSAVGKYERLPNSFPSVEVLVKLADYFETSTDYLLLGENPPASIENNINGSMTNSSVVQTNNGGAVIDSKAISPEAAELLRIYNNLSGRERLKLLNFAVDMEEGASK